MPSRPMHFVANGQDFILLWLNSVPLCDLCCIIFFIHWWTHTGCFCILPIVGMLQWTQGCIHLFKLVFSLNTLEWNCGIIWQFCFFIFWGTSILISIMVAPIYITTNSAWGFPFSAFSITFVVSYNNSHSDRCESDTHCGFDLHFDDLVVLEYPFHVPIGDLYICI